MSSRSGTPIEILLVEDNPGDVRLTLEALKESKVHNIISVVKDGVEALAFLRKKDRYSTSPSPDIILLDLNLPKKTGIEVLQDIKKDENLKHIPVVILTTSKDEEDILKTYTYHANAYVTKPVDFDKFLKVIRGIEDFWLNIVKLPHK
ncbi:MAG: response regulator [Spirochaetales bacterium]|nr:response regulator [Spirochaetales bacterium]